MNKRLIHFLSRTLTPWGGKEKISHHHRAKLNVFSMLRANLCTSDTDNRKTGLGCSGVGISRYTGGSPEKRNRTATAATASAGATGAAAADTIITALLLLPLLLLLLLLPLLLLLLLLLCYCYRCCYCRRHVPWLRVSRDPMRNINHSPHAFPSVVQTLVIFSAHGVY